MFAHTEIVGLSLVSRRERPINFHAADGTERMIRGLFDGSGILGVGRRIQPALALILKHRCSLACHFPAEVALDHAQSEVHSGGETAGGSQISRFNEASSAFNMNVRILHRKVDVSAVMCRGSLAGEETGNSTLRAKQQANSKVVQMVMRPEQIAAEPEQMAG